MSNTQNELGTEKVGKLLFKLSVPAITAQLINMLYNLVDRIYIGHIPEVGATALTGVGVTLSIIMLITAFSSLVGMGGAPQAAIKMGEGNNEHAERILGNCTSLLIIISLVLTTIFLVFKNPILLAFGASEITLPYASDYISIYLIGTIAVQISLGLNAFITSQGFAKTSMLTVLIGAVLNIVLDPVFIFGFNMGVKGAALATILSQAVSAIWVIRFLTSDKSHLRIRKKYLKIEPKIILPVVALGISPFIMTSTEAAISICFNTSLLKYGGDLAVGAMTILASMMQLVMLPIQGLSQGAQPIISFNFGARKIDRVKQAFKLLLICCLGYTFVFTLCIQLFPEVFVSLFSNSAELTEITVWAVRIYMAATAIFGIQIACQQTFVATGQAIISLFLACLRKIILLMPLIFILPHFFENKVFAVFLAEPVSDFIAVAVTGILFLMNFNKVLAKKAGEVEETY